jgi:hypothetical protein
MAAWALGTLALLGALAWAASTVFFLTRIRLPRRALPGQVTLLLAVTGRAPGLEALFAALAVQTLRPRRLLCAVESEVDPAAARLRALAPLLPFPLEVVVAGTAPHRSQKATSLIAGLARLDARDQAVVLLDADIRPQPWWLSALATPALAGEADLVSGYRWQVVERGAGPLRQLVTWLDRALALAPRFGGSRMVWGGSIAIAAAALPALDLPRALDRTLSTDCAIGGRAAEAGLRVLTRRAVMLPTPAEGGERDTWRFLRRQLQILRIYRPAWWALIALVLHAEAMALPLALLALGGEGMALAFLAAVVAAGLFRAGADAWIGARIGAPPGAQWAVALLPILAAPALCVLAWQSASWRRVRWRHVEYEVRGPFDVRVRRRDAAA